MKLLFQVSCQRQSFTEKRAKFQTAAAKAIESGPFCIHNVKAVKIMQ